MDNQSAKITENDTALKIIVHSNNPNHPPLPIRVTQFDPEYFDLRSDWLNGEWDDEPDKREWIDPVTNLDCLVVRHKMGALCGYVGVPEDHPDFGTDYNALESQGGYIEVHGGITYSGLCQGKICHDSTNKVWWFGFDCLHLHDLVPAMNARLSRSCPAEYLKNEGNSFYETNDVYRNMDYVTDQAALLALQLSARS